MPPREFVWGALPKKQKCCDKKVIVWQVGLWNHNKNSKLKNSKKRSAHLHYNGRLSLAIHKTVQQWIKNAQKSKIFKIEFEYSEFSELKVYLKRNLTILTFRNLPIHLDVIELLFLNLNIQELRLNIHFFHFLDML
jgi:hypothetical protein